MLATGQTTRDHSSCISEIGNRDVAGTSAQHGPVSLGAWGDSPGQGGWGETEEKVTTDTRGVS